MHVLEFLDALERRDPAEPVDEPRNIPPAVVGDAIAERGIQRVIRADAGIVFEHVRDGRDDGVAGTISLLHKSRGAAVVGPITARPPDEGRVLGIAR